MPDLLNARCLVSRTQRVWTLKLRENTRRISDLVVVSKCRFGFANGFGAPFSIQDLKLSGFRETAT
ncbi:hypothetical protein [Silicimonas sp. MF1-12-2]|jgi:hypothetical protein|uniref:hypothetical protein n=1 Tax=Silicimonas sp. MF1-12-2 TaxID=3384793 RepID=UPI0039B44113